MLQNTIQKTRWPETLTIRFLADTVQSVLHKENDMGFGGGGGGGTSTAEIFMALAKKQEDARLAEQEDLKLAQERNRVRLAGGRGRAANIFAGFTDESLGANSRKLGAAA